MMDCIAISATVVLELDSDKQQYVSAFFAGNFKTPRHGEALPTKAGPYRGG
jgi:hypothetical protein